MRVFFGLMMLFFLTSCDKFSFTKKHKIQVLDTIVDFTSIDTSPSFKVCDSLIDKKNKSNCFRNTFHKKIGIELQKHSFVVKDSINETVFVNVIINAKGKVVFKDLKSSDRIKKELPSLDSLIEDSVMELPIIYPAIKRGIPVTTKYQLPIKIQLKNN